MLWHIGLDQPPARDFGLATGAARYLLQQLIGAFPSPRVAMGQPQIAIHHADQSEAGKMMPLGDQLRADNDINFAIALILSSSCRISSMSVMRSLDRIAVRASGKRSPTSSATRSTPGPQATRRILFIYIRGQTAQYWRLL